MEAYRAFGNGQAQTHTASLSAASIVQAVKRPEQLLQCFGGNAGTAIGNAHHRFRATSGAFVLLQMNLYRSAFASVTDGVADHVLDGAVQQGCISADSPASGGNFAAYVAMP